MGFSEKIIKWYKANQRQLPWRETTNPYLIWVSEIILQQTQVQQGLSYYLRFIERFPDVKSLAAASVDEVLQYWQGLGYYSRARNLHQAARTIVENGGIFPKDYKSVRALKGVGDYTAAAICSFAYKMPYAAIDGNAYRVLSRVFGIKSPIDTTSGKKEIAFLAEEMLDKKEPDVYNQAMMDFGSKLCSPKSPLCLNCPVSDICIAFALDKVSSFPVKSIKPKQRKRYLVYVFVKYQNMTYIHKRKAGDIWAGLYEPILIETDRLNDESAAVKQIHELLGSTVTEITCIKKHVKHVLTHQLLIVDFYEANINDSMKIKGYQLVLISHLDNYPVSRLVEKLFMKILSS